MIHGFKTLTTKIKTQRQTEIYIETKKKRFGTFTKDSFFRSDKS